jgi:phosphate transport system substrate-binding protein
MLRSLARRGGLVVAALALPVLVLGSTATASTPAAAKLSSATINGDGSTFQLPFNQVTIGAYKQQQHAVTINYQGNGSGAGRTDFADGTVDFAGTDAPYKSTDPQPPKPFFYFPTVVAPITVSYNLSGVKLQLSGETIAKIFQTDITTWNAPAIKAENPKAKLPSTKITVVHRSDSSGTTENFTKFLTKSAGSAWTLGSGSTVSWPSGTQGGTGNSGVAKLVKQTDGAIGYVDFSDAEASDLTFAKIKNSSGKYVAATLAGASAAAAGATINADLTYDPLYPDGAKAYPITSPTWILAYQSQTDAAKGAALKGWLGFIYGTKSDQGQKLAGTVDYAPLPKKLLKMAKQQLTKMTVPAS